MAADPRRQLLEIFEQALHAVHGATCVGAWLREHPLAAPLYLIAVGKAACAMARGAHEALGGAIADGLVITKHAYAEPLPWPVIEAAHPLPDATSLAAGDRLVEFVARIPAAAQVLVLLSGGASALVEKLPAGVDLETLRALNTWLLASGRDIATMNRFRRRLSLIKDGRLAALLTMHRDVQVSREAGRRERPMHAVTCLAISDVPGDDPRVLGSGPLVPDDTPLPDVTDAPAVVRAALAHSPPPPSPRDACVTQVHFAVVANLDGARRAAAHAAERMGMRARVTHGFVGGDAIVAGERLARELLRSEPGVVHVWGGETTVVLPAHPGRGGRCQSLALAAAQVLAGHDHVYLLASGTDGADGPTADAGALVDGGTIARGNAQALDARRALRDADAGTFLEVSGDLVHTGPTGTNVMDLMLGLKL